MTRSDGLQFQSKHGYQQAPFQKGRKASGGEDSGGEEEDLVGAQDKSGEESGHANDRSEEAPVSFQYDPLVFFLWEGNNVDISCQMNVSDCTLHVIPLFSSLNQLHLTPCS